MKRKSLLAILVTLFFIIFLLVRLDINTIINTVLKMDFKLLLLTIPFIILLYIIKTKKWLILLDSIDIKIGFLEAFKIYLIGTFYGVITPAKVGEFTRSFYLQQKKSQTIPTILVDRITDIVTLLLLSIVLILALFNNNELINLIILMIVLFISAIFIVTNKRIVTMIFKLFKINDDHKENYFVTFNRIIKNKKALYYVLLLTFCYYMVNMFIFWLIIKSLNPALNEMLALSLPIIIIMGNIPITVSGLGIREFVSVLIFSLLNEEPAYGFSASLILYVITCLIPGLGGSVFTIRKRKNENESK
ncbi:lysylphosphatidylglycerol synthase transmembrane domain-containing protein [Methanooceanicella nereidis]|nr:lysylphosphatidylglycerol synthase transmembrane domain-containing protein [Methanocella sp. CWC-04]